MFKLKNAILLDQFLIKVLATHLNDVLHTMY